MKKLITTALLGIVNFASTIAVSANAYAASTPIDGTDIHQLGDVLNRVISFMLGIAGAVIIILIVVGALRYILSAGDPKATMAARNTITFAIIGLVIILLAASIVIFIGKFLGSSNNFSTIKIGQ